MQTLSKLNDQQADTLLREALAHLNRRDLPSAERLVDIVLATRADDANALYVMGQLRHLQGRLSDAQNFYRRALAVDPQRPEILHQLGQALSVAGQMDEAITVYKDSLGLRPDRAETLLELGMAYVRKQDYAAAERALRDVLRLDPSSLAARQSLSAALINLGRPKEGEALARSSLPQAAGDPRWFAAFKHNIAIAISEQHRYDEAVQAYEEVQAIAPSLPLLDINCCNALQAAGRKDDAESLYRRVLAREPLDLMAHRGLSQLLWRLNRADFLASYDAAIAAHPTNSALYIEKGRQQLLYTLNEEARTTFAQALKIAPQEERAHEGIAAALSRLGRYDEAIKEFESIAARWPESAEIRCGLAECYLRSGDSESALLAAEHALTCAPHNQLALALRETALRQLNNMDGSEDYETLIEIFDLMGPEGYPDLGAFHRELTAYLVRLLGEMPARDSAGQRLISRTGGTLFGAGEPVIAALRGHVDKAVATYVKRLHADESHPFLRRRDKELRYWGSWSTRVAPHGSIPNHIHERGWLSAVYFVNAPEDVNSDAKGWLKFGEPPFDAHLRKPVVRRVKPLPGRLVLFPSYFWHGSIPSDAPDARLTISFDAVPEASRV